ncbi:peroxisomal membrane protein PMP22-like isoform X1 [Durio zibethinus]|uniref:Peroxisomal membrane protein PMP22-like isoform X1 n=1 Tax=Durio zibethinus TaxID=66656 RepID=A0A6P6BJW8_DURZI|nr:peroxisomal membrane protein PMP22-like isoform X1 [Durio zibethinus]
MGSVAKKGLQKYLLQLQHHPLRTKVSFLLYVFFVSCEKGFGICRLKKVEIDQNLQKLVQAITAAVLSGISDTVSQKLSGIPRLQLRRILLKMLFGFAYLGPFGHYMYILLDKIFKGKRDSKTVAKKVVLEQLTSSPCNNLLFMIYYGVVVEGRPWMHVKTRIKKEYPKVQLTAWTFWPVVGWINHQYVPLQFRVIFNSLIAFCWGIFLNLRARSMALPKSK